MGQEEEGFSLLVSGSVSSDGFLSFLTGGGRPGPVPSPASPTRSKSSQGNKGSRAERSGSPGPSFPWEPVAPRGLAVLETQSHAPAVTTPPASRQTPQGQGACGSPSSCFLHREHRREGPEQERKARAVDRQLHSRVQKYRGDGGEGGGSSQSPEGPARVVASIHRHVGPRDTQLSSTRATGALMYLPVYGVRMGQKREGLREAGSHQDQPLPTWVPRHPGTSARLLLPPQA